MTGLKAIIDALEPVDGGWRGTIPDNWLQGRTSYGGLSAALALHAAQRSDVALPPLRSALVAFVGPLSGDVVIRATRLRRGRNAAFVQADVESAAGLGLRATFVFMGAVESSIHLQNGSAPDFPVPGPGDRTFNGHSAVPFTQNFELLDRRDPAAAAATATATATAPDAEWLRWVRLVDREGLDPMVELVAVADCLPPAALKLIGRPAPVSSMTWQLNLLGSAPATRDGWWLLRAVTDHAKDGNSSQRMAIWNADGSPIADQMQSVAIFA